MGARTGGGTDLCTIPHAGDVIACSFQRRGGDRSARAFVWFCLYTESFRSAEVKYCYHDSAGVSVVLTASRLNSEIEESHAACKYLDYRSPCRSDPEKNAGNHGLVKKNPAAASVWPLRSQYKETIIPQPACGGSVSELTAIGGAKQQLPNFQI